MHDRLIKLLQDSSYLDVLDEEHWLLAAEQLLANGVVVIDTDVVSLPNRPLISQYMGRPIDEVINLIQRSKWISVEERLPTEDEYLTHHNDGLDTLKRITVAYMTDTIEYTIGCYDGYKWMNQLGNKKINDVIAWKPFELYEAPKGGAE